MKINLLYLNIKYKKKLSRKNKTLFDKKYFLKTQN